MSKSKITPIGQAILDLINNWDIARQSEYVKKPISYALYHTWKLWDEKEKPNKAQAEEQRIKELEEKIAKLDKERRKLISAERGINDKRKTIERSERTEEVARD